MRNASDDDKSPSVAADFVDVLVWLLAVDADWAMPNRLLVIVEDDMAAPVFERPTRGRLRGV
jgi:hypothetical protein